MALVVVVVGLNFYNTEEVMMSVEDDGERRTTKRRLPLALTVALSCSSRRAGGDYREVVKSEMPQMCFLLLSLRKRVNG